MTNFPGNSESYKNSVKFQVNSSLNVGIFHCLGYNPWEMCGIPSFFIFENVCTIHSVLAKVQKLTNCEHISHPAADLNGFSFNFKFV